ncbi:MAG: UbiE protein, partial [Erythrobacter sp.]|nr:UbiE protein [Erythrobacter sp.]
PDYAAIIERASAALPTGGRMALLGLKHPERWPRWLIEIGIVLTKPFGVAREYEEFRPWLPARKVLREVHFREFLAGCAYEFVGAKS